MIAERDHQLGDSETNLQHFAQGDCRKALQGRSYLVIVFVWIEVESHTCRFVITILHTPLTAFSEASLCIHMLRWRTDMGASVHAARAEHITHRVLL